MGSNVEMYQRKNLCEYSDYQDSISSIIKNNFSPERSFSRLEFSTLMFVGLIKPLFPEKDEFEKRYASKKISILEVLDDQISDARKRINSFSKE